MSQQTRAGRYADLIQPGLVQPLQAIPFHHEAPLIRRLMAGGQVHPDAQLHVAVHHIRALPPADRHYSVPHTHTCAELNLLLTFDHLLVRLTFNDEVYPQSAPATIFIPPGVQHSANVVEGTGFFIAILPQHDYAATFSEAAAPNRDRKQRG